MKTYTPIRYPGGKAKTYNEIVSLLETNNLIGCTYVEAYAGGIGLALKLLLNNKVSKLVLNDIDYNLYCFWETVLSNSEELIKLIEKASITFDNRNKQKEIYKEPFKYSKLEVAFSFLYLNRTNRSGILKAGPIYKEESKLGARFTKQTIIDIIKVIAEQKEKISFYNMDALEFLRKIVSKQKKETFIFLDPPYYKMGSGLYTKFYKHDDHVRLKEEVLKIKGNKKWIVTYDFCDEIKQIYSNVKNGVYNIRYSAYDNRMGKELIFYSDNLKPVDMNKSTH